MQSEQLAKARAHLGELVKRARHGGETTELTDHGKPAAYIVSPETWLDYQRIQAELAELKKSQLLREASAAMADKNFTGYEKFGREDLDQLLA